ncbi:G-protein coupled estrogen receptor 1-like [Narcine bancroftii]|uniref:G-protein coupled estrogen receptor 1-like n=1 Tax=Narcine bancroftii TaxID=1343680 RepID=UPI003831BAA6
MALQGTTHSGSLLSNCSTSSPADNGDHTLDNNVFIKIMNLQNLISRGVYVYSMFGLVGLLLGIFILATYSINLKKKIKFEKLDIFIFTVTVADFILILFSITDIMRPNPMKTSALSCAALSFFFNVPYFYVEYIHVVVSFFLVYGHIELARRALNKPLVTILVTIGLSIFWSALITALIGVSQEPYKKVNCFVDPLEAPTQYGIIKFVFGFIMPNLIILGSILHFMIHSTCMQNPQNPPSCRRNVHSHRLFLALVSVTFICHLVYNVLLLLRQEAVNIYTIHKNQLMVIIGELIVFVGSCLCLVAIVTFDEKMQNNVRKILRCNTRTQNNRGERENETSLC